jgi:hypothetical protein
MEAVSTLAGATRTGRLTLIHEVLTGEVIETTPAKGKNAA